uniref:Uncharacterized protein n=1 Tax=viral metagenome TaxID=1070528 RepID=A0A6C0BSD7_9ZZZZ
MTKLKIHIYYIIYMYNMDLDDQHTKKESCRSFYKYTNIPISESILKQRKWREKQINIFYKSGRPIYEGFRDNKHLFYKTSRGYYVGLY